MTAIAFPIRQRSVRLHERMNSPLRRRKVRLRGASADSAVRQRAASGHLRVRKLTIIDCLLRS
jgi:hypothetical protein